MLQCIWAMFYKSIDGRNVLQIARRTLCGEGLTRGLVRETNFILFTHGCLNT